MYLQIADDLRIKIETGELAPGAQLPTELELRERYEASRNTIRDAIKRLISLGLVETSDGKALRHRAGAQAVNLRKDKPHPVRAFLSGSKLGTDLGEAGCLSVDETPQMIRIVDLCIPRHHHSLFPI